MEVTLTEFRKDTKKYFDMALSEPVYIKRGGVVFELGAFGVTGRVVEALVDTERDTNVPTPKVVKSPKDVEKKVDPYRFSGFIDKSYSARKKK